MYPQLSRLNAALIIALAVATVPGIVGPRAGGREGSTRVTMRSGLHRISASEAVVHGCDDGATDVTTAGDLASDSTGCRAVGFPPGLPAALTTVVPPSADSIRLDAPPPVALHTADPFLRPLGRAPPVR